MKLETLTEISTCSLLHIGTIDNFAIMSARLSTIPHHLSLILCLKQLIDLSTRFCSKHRNKLLTSSKSQTHKPLPIHNHFLHVSKTLSSTSTSPTTVTVQKIFFAIVKHNVDKLAITKLHNINNSSLHFKSQKDKI